MKSLQQLINRKAWLEAQLVRVDAEIKARTPRKKRRRTASDETGSPGRSAGADDPGSPDNNDE